MLITEVVDGLDYAPDHPELLGKRILITGIKGALGIEIARAFSEARTRVVLHAVEEGPETVALGELVAAHAMDVRLFTGSFADNQATLEFARSAIQAFGGIDVVINIVEVGSPPAGANAAHIERCVTELLSVPFLVTKVAANRMRTTLTQGTILNIVTIERGASATTRLLGAIARSALGGVTRTEAQAAASAGIRINAIAPAATLAERGGQISGDPDIATLALHLASPKSEQLSGLVFEACFG